MPMICQIPKEDTYDLPQGRFKAVLRGVRDKTQANHPDRQQVRLLFNVQIPSLKHKNPMAGRTFNLDLKAGSELRCFLMNWLGAGAFNNNTTIDLESLVGRSAELTLTHHHNSGYDRPFVNIEAINPADTSKLAESVEQTVIQMPADDADCRRAA